jgi:hypothetical protein
MRPTVLEGDDLAVKDRVRRKEQPSRIAASEISLGTSWKKLRISQTTNGNVTPP